jgi:myosin heavy subunit
MQVEGVEGCRVVGKGGSGSGASLKQACELLGVDAKAFCQCLTFRELQTTAPGKAQ